MRLLNRITWSLGALGLLSGVLGVSAPRMANAEGQVLAQNTGQNYAAPPAASLQVTGTPTRFTISANRADVQEVLKLVFDQAGRDFYLDSSVVGQVTLKLTDRSLAAVLQAICGQTFLRYRFDPKENIIKFERDEEAIKTAIARMRALDIVMLSQLRAMGLNVPNDFFSNGQIQGGLGQGGTAFGAGGFRSLGGNGPRGDNGPNGPGGGGREGGGGFGGGGALNNASPQSMARRGNARNPTPDAKDTLGEKTQARLRGPNQKRGAGEPNGESQADGVLNYYSLNALTQNNSEEYRQFVTQNKFVFFNIPAGQGQPIADVLQQLGVQANVPVLVDKQNIPTDQRFRIEGKISPRPLPDALNAIAPLARLEWRWVGNTIFVTTAPDFQIFYGDSTVPRASSYTNRSQTPSSQRGKGGALGGAGKPGEPEKKSQDKESKPEDKGKGK